MKGTYNSHILKFKGVLWVRDHLQFTIAVEASNGSEVIVRLDQPPNKKRDLDLNENTLKAAIKAVGIDISKPFNAELIIRDPSEQLSVQDALALDHGFKDQNDDNTFHWGGNRGDGNVLKHPVRNAPMFFRDNGMNVDLVDLYQGGSIFLALNGPSFAKIDHEKLMQPGILTFGTNNGGHLFRPNFWTCVDDPTRFMDSIWMDPKITKFVPMAHFQKPIWDSKAEAVSSRKVVTFPNVIGFRRNELFIASQWLCEDTINWGNHRNRGGGRSVMLSALRICYLLGFRRVYLIGCDFHMDKDNRYWFPEQRSKQAIRNNMDSFKILNKYFKQLHPYFEEVGFDVRNCTPDSGLEVFPYYELNKALKEALVNTKSPTDGMYVNRFKNKKK